jgi:hypothetical protein
LVGEKLTVGQHQLSLRFLQGSDFTIEEPAPVTTINAEPAPVTTIKPSLNQTNNATTTTNNATTTFKYAKQS